MIYKKLFFPIGGGEEFEERLYGAFLIAKKFNTHLEVLESRLKSSVELNHSLLLPKEIQNSIDEVLDSQYEQQDKELFDIVSSIIKEVDIDENLIKVNIKEGIRSSLIEQDSKFCDLVIAAAPPSGITTATFETAVLKSGKPVLMFPRIMRKLSFNNILIGWNNSSEVSRALTSSIEILKLAKKVKIISSTEYVKDEKILDELISYLSEHDIEASYEIVKTTRIPGQALLNTALDENFDLIVAGAFGQKGLRELMFGGTTRYLLENSPIPVFLSH